MISAGGGAQDKVIARTRSEWKKFMDLLPILTCRDISLCLKGRVPSKC